MHFTDVTANKLSGDEVAIIFSFLTPKVIMRLRRVCSKWRDATQITIVPQTEFEVNSVETYNAMRVMSTALPNLQQISLKFLGHGHKYSDGEDLDERMAANTANYTAFDIDIISRFRNLHTFEIYRAPLNGRYPALFDFPFLQKLTISDFNDCSILKWDLEMLSGLPSLKELDCCDNDHNPLVSGNLSSLRILRDTLEKVDFFDCRNVEGNFMDLADFPRLKKLDLRETNVRGDIRDIRGHDFSALEDLWLPEGVYGGIGYEFEDISDAPEFMQAIHHLLRRSPTMFDECSLSEAFYWCLSREAPDWYAWSWESENPPPPFQMQFVQAGSRLGWSWCTLRDDPRSDEDEEELLSCEINWLDPEPSRESSDYETYVQELQRIEQYIAFYRGYYQPPTEEEYRRLCEGWRG